MGANKGKSLSISFHEPPDQTKKYLTHDLQSCL